jgi:hypothetical protein
MSLNLEEINAFSYTFRFVRLGIHFELGHLVAQLVQALRSKPIPDGVFGIFHLHNPSGHTMTLGSTQPLTEMSTGIISWGNKGDRCVGLTNLPPSFADSYEVWEPQRPRNLRASSDLYREWFTFLFYTFEIPWVKWSKCMRMKSTHLKH